MENNIILIAIVFLLAIAFIIFLIRRNVKDEQDINPDLTDELEKKKNEQNRIK